MAALAPGSVVGILGGGQLGRMLAVAAAQLGYRTHIFAPEEDSVAAELAAEFTCAHWSDATAMARFGAQCDVLTYEFENVPVAPLQALQAIAIHPPITALEVAQDRIAEKHFAQQAGGRVAPYRGVATPADLEHAIAAIGAPAILKTVRDGYDGKGQCRINDDHDLAEAKSLLAHGPAIWEGLVRFTHEFSVILVRGKDGEVRYWDSPHNVHINGILATSSLPAPAAIAAQLGDARALAHKIADQLDYVGVMTCEFFVGDDGPVFNEMAPRVHNSGHWTIEGAITSQFENHIRAIAGLPLGDTGLAADEVIMTNLIGGGTADWYGHLNDPAAHLHLYGKSESRPERKMGHVTRLDFHKSAR
ncbi:MAG: 5-(carboxyamino)imidazole ribonucleotide synthase [Parasphingorhabdus sp.]|nr:5-(carboxyamino)imidazole ribonucleotide synthase [Parasphingorhabdus sp.]